MTPKKNYISGSANKQSRARLSASINEESTHHFLDLLGATRCTFQTFDDDARRKDAKLARILHGSLDQHADQLADLNRLGAGVFVAINQTDGKGRRRTNIKRVRAVSVDLDGAPLAPVRQCALRPHIIVESSAGRYHAYWRVKKFPIDQFEDTQRAIAKRFDGDPAVAKLTHIARLPGFNHCKGKPFRTHIIEVNDLPAYTAEEILAEFPPEQQPHRQPVSLDGRIVLPTDDPVKCAEEFVQNRYRTPDGICCLHYYRGSFYRWRDTHCAAIDEQEVRSALYAFLRDALAVTRNGYAPFKPTPAKVNAILDGLRSGVYHSRDKNAPFFVPPHAERSADCLIACNNGLLDIGTRKLEPHSPHLFNVNCLPFDYDPDALPANDWSRFLRQLWPNDAEARGTLQQIFGLMLTADTSHQKIFMIVGPKRSGKGTIARVLTAMLGKDNVASPTLSSLNGEFGLAPLLDKRAAIISDARLGRQTTTVTERLLSISGEDALTVNRKYRDHWTGRLGVRFLILTNELPRIADASGALASRFVVLMLQESFLGREDLELTDKLLAELPGILNWSLRGLDRLRERGRFRMPQSSLEAIRQLEDLASPVGAFIREWCETGTDKACNVKELFDAFGHWCHLEGHKAGSSIVFGRNLRAVIPQLATKNVGTKRSYIGVDLSEHGEDSYQASKRCL